MFKRINPSGRFLNLCYKALFYSRNICRLPKSQYLCTVFFIVLDLRLTKVGVQRYSFFYALTSDQPTILRQKARSNPIYNEAPPFSQQSFVQYKKLLLTGHTTFPRRSNALRPKTEIPGTAYSQNAALMIKPPARSIPHRLPCSSIEIA